jgi:hypothetical protein
MMENRLSQIIAVLSLARAAGFSSLPETALRRILNAAVEPAKITEVTGDGFLTQAADQES